MFMLLSLNQPYYGVHITQYCHMKKVGEKWHRSVWCYLSHETHYFLLLWFWLLKIHLTLTYYIIIIFNQRITIWTIRLKLKFGSIWENLNKVSHVTTLISSINNEQWSHWLVVTWDTNISDISIMGIGIINASHWIMENRFSIYWH